MYGRKSVGPKILLAGVALEQKSCLELIEITSFVLLVLFKDGGRRVSPRFNIFVSDVNQCNKEVGWVQRFPCMEFIIVG